MVKVYFKVLNCLFLLKATNLGLNVSWLCLFVGSKICNFFDLCKSFLIYLKCYY